MTLKYLFGRTVGNALLISLAGACVMAAAPVGAANAATLEELYRTEAVVRNCAMPFVPGNINHDGTDITYDEDTAGENLTVSRSRGAKVTREIETTVSFLQPSPEDFAAIFDPMNAEIEANIEQFCIDNIPDAQSVLNSL
jgi:hypothetical protein